VIELMAPVFAPVATALGFITVDGLPAVFCTFANTARAEAESTAMIALRNIILPWNLLIAFFP
jgi:hypothetical protein